MQFEALTCSGGPMASDKLPDRDRREPDDETVPSDATDETRKDLLNPPRTTTGVWTSPKFGSAGSGGAELEPGPERD
jgi:hypothetical protein